MTDPFLHDDAPYVLGALGVDEARAFEEHLLDCADCRARVADLRPTADLLALLPSDFDPEPGPVPDTLLPGLLHRVAAERRRRRVVTAAVAAVAAACAIALAVLAWPSGSGSGSAPVVAARQLQSLKASPLEVRASLVSKAWGTEIELHCSYPSYEHQKFAYDLVVIDRAHRRHVAGDWTLVPGRDSIEFTAGTSVPWKQIERLQVRTAGGTPLLELRL